MPISFAPAQLSPTVPATRTMTPARPSPTPAPSPTPELPIPSHEELATNLVGQSVRFCRDRGVAFDGVVERAVVMDHPREGLRIDVAARATNVGSRAFGTFQLTELLDERGRSSWPPTCVNSPWSATAALFRCALPISPTHYWGSVFIEGQPVVRPSIRITSKSRPLIRPRVASSSSFQRGSGAPLMNQSLPLSARNMP